MPPGSFCGGDLVCGGGAFCYNNHCECPFGQIIINLQCEAAPISRHPHQLPSPNTANKGRPP